MKPLHLGRHPVGDGHPAIFMAEVNSAFDKDLEAGKRMVKAAADAGCDILKAEMLLSTGIVLDDGTRFEYEYGDHGAKTSESWYDIVARKINPLSFYEELFLYSRSLGLEFVVSVYELEAVSFLAEIGAAGIKIPSSNLNHEPLIAAAAKTGIPLVLDTNKAYLGDIDRALKWCERHGNTDVILNHHPGSGPAPAEQHNLNVIKFLKDTFQLPVGLSCHYIGDEILYAAIGVGANVLEKPISFDPAKKDLDTIFAAHIDSLPAIMSKVRACSSALGNGRPRNFISGRELDQWMGVVADRDIASGEQLTTENCRFAWPCAGVSVEHWNLIEHRKAKTAIASGQPVAWRDVNFS